MKNAVVATPSLSLHGNSLSDDLLAEALLLENDISTLTILTGPVGSGKTRLCGRLLALAAERSLPVGGVYSPAVMTGDEKTGIDLVILPGRERRRLAVARTTPAGRATFSARATPDARVFTKHWVMDEAAVAWGDAHLARLTPPELLILDELGPLEFIAGSGLQAAFPLLDGRGYRWGVVVIRPDLLAAAQTRWPWAQVVSLDSEPGAGAS